MSSGWIRVRGARTHNLKDMHVDLPRGQWTLVAGVSGSGKSSLVLDTLAAESRRRYLGTLRHAVRGVDLLPRPDVDGIEGLPPAVAQGFRTRAPSRRHTLGTMTELTRALRVLVARQGTPHCPTCSRPLPLAHASSILEGVLALPARTRVLLTAPWSGVGEEALARAREEGFVRVRRISDNTVLRLDEQGTASPAGATDDVDAEARYDVVVDRLVIKAEARDRIAASIDQALVLGGGRLRIVTVPKTGEATVSDFATTPWCGHCERGYPLPRPALLSFNHPEGACATCAGRGVVHRLTLEDAFPGAHPLKRLVQRLAPALPPARRPAFRRAFRAWREAHALSGTTLVSQLPKAARQELRALRVDGLKLPLGKHLLAHGKAERIGCEVACTSCEGARLAPFAAAIRLADQTLPALEAMRLEDLATWLNALRLSGAVGELLEPVREDALARLAFLRDVGLGYLQTGRPAPTLSRGERRRAELAATCAARMSGLLFVLDEPTAGLHPMERTHLRARLRALVDDGNTLITVDHDPQMLAASDHWVVLGPGAGREGGDLVLATAREGVAASAPEAAWLPRPAPCVFRDAPREAEARVRLFGASLRHLQDVDIAFPVPGLTALAGVSGSGKTTLGLHCIAPAVERARQGAPLDGVAVARVEGAEAIDRVVTATGEVHKSSRSLAGSQLGVLPPLRRLYAETLEARARGWAPNWFSTHAPGGRCEACTGTGLRTLDLPEAIAVRIVCDVCDGRRFRRETDVARWRGFPMADLLLQPIAELAQVFRDVPRVGAPLEAAVRVGLGYVRLGEATAHLSRRGALAHATGRCPRPSVAHAHALRAGRTVHRIASPRRAALAHRPAGLGRWRARGVGDRTPAARPRGRRSCRGARTWRRRGWWSRALRGCAARARGRDITNGGAPSGRKGPARPPSLRGVARARDQQYVQRLGR